MEPCPCRLGSTALAVLELFERQTGEFFSDSPGAVVGSRVRSIAKVLGNLAREMLWDPPLESLTLHGGLRWSRRPRQQGDVLGWREATEAVEAHARPLPRLRVQMAEADAGLARWVSEHRYLVATAVERGESGMALLMLWEVDHGRPYPSTGGQGLSGALKGFTRRLQDRISQDAVLFQWLV